jgi:uncharacterized protein (TIGR03435 family)
MKSSRAIALTFILSGAAIGQQFDRVSVRLAAQGANATRPAFHSDAVTLSALNTGLRQLIQRAYGVEDYQIVAPAWLRQTRFDLVAKFPEFATDAESYQAGIQAMMQKTLAERFRLAVHKESRILPVYAMSVENGGIKFRETTPGVEHTNPIRGHYSGSKITMAVLAQYLTTVVGTPVADRTGLTGVYDVTLSFPSVAALPVALSDELGVRLDKRKESVEMLIVDHVENLPSQQRQQEISSKPRQQAVLSSIDPAALALAAAPANMAIAPAQPQNTDGGAVVETARWSALAIARSMPDFIVNRTTTRYRGTRNQVPHNQIMVNQVMANQAMRLPVGTMLQQQLSQNAIPDWQKLDTIGGTVASEKGREVYSNIVLNGKPVAALPSRGVWSQGEFSAALVAVFSPDSAAQFVAKGRDPIRNRRAVRYSFAVDRAHSIWSLRGENDTRFSPAFDGAVWIDEGTGQILRIAISARGLPDNYPGDTVESTIDYDLVKIADAQYLLPTRSELLTCQRHGNLCFRNESFFRDYRKFEADSTLTFDK